MNDFLAQLSEISGLAEGYIWLFALVFLRVGAAVSLFPAIGEQMVPQRVKLAAALALTVIVAPAVAALPDPPQGLFGPLATEAGAGLIIGIGLRLLVLGLQTAGTIAAQSTSLAQMFAGTGPEPQPIISNLLVLAALALFVSMGGLSRAAGLLIQSYDFIPPGQLPAAADLAEWGLGRIAAAFSLGFSLAAPFVLAALLYNLALGAINRAMPQLMVSFVGAPALTLGGLALLALAAPVMLSVWRDALVLALDQPFGG
ncbi:MAG: flagellar biosynthetic protein FliR [Rhodobacter sp.]|nr:flagellar biosynthetic protein FliR [Rhodobacter sp.]MBK8438943.1 flagellar biosynthetic protein FliR [Rhodobacter sp.]